MRRHRSPGPDAFDRRRGTDTSGIVPLWRLDIASPNARHGERYEATQEEELGVALRALDLDASRHTFVDLGCGKGRTLIVAAALGFGRVIGVEFAAELCRIARRNMAIAQVPNAEVLHADAARFRFPAAGIVLYLFNPFSQDVMREVLAHLQEGVDRECFIVYKRARCADWLDAQPFLERLPSPQAAPQMSMWRSRAAAATPGEGQ